MGPAAAAVQFVGQAISAIVGSPTAMAAGTTAAGAIATSGVDPTASKILNLEMPRLKLGQHQQDIQAISVGAAKRAEEQERARIRALMGRQSTILTGGFLSEPPATRKTLLGA